MREIKRMRDGTKEQWLKKISEEYDLATSKFSKFNSAHEGYAVILEELDELWECVKTNKDYRELQDEARQVGAMALRFLVDIC
ncbi:MAG: hypothetical protein ABIH23_05855 [bacterium]